MEDSGLSVGITWHVLKEPFTFTLLRRECLVLMSEGFFNDVVLTTLLKQKAFQKLFIVKRLSGLCFLY